LKKQKALKGRGFSRAKNGVMEIGALAPEAQGIGCSTAPEFS
jgi:hypothetical protein